MTRYLLQLHAGIAGSRGAVVADEQPLDPQLVALVRQALLGEMGRGESLEDAVRLVDEIAEAIAAQFGLGASAARMLREAVARARDEAVAAPWQAPSSTAASPPGQ